MADVADAGAQMEQDYWSAIGAMTGLRHLVGACPKTELPAPDHLCDLLALVQNQFEKVGATALALTKPVVARE